MINNSSLVDRIIEIDKETDKIIKEVTHGLPEKLFRKKIVIALYEKNIIKEVHDILTKMGNTELVATLNLTEHIIDIEYIPKYMPEAYIDYKKIKENPNYLINEYYRLIDQDEAIANISKSKENYKIVRSRANIEKIEKYLLGAMTNEQINELAKTSNDWNKKLYYYGFLKDGKEPCKFKKQKNGKYYVIKVKYINVKDRNEYLYICNDTSIRKGNKIIVSSYVGFSLDLKAAKVLEVNYYDFEELPISFNDSEEVIGKVNDNEELSSIKYSFGKLKCFDNKGNEVQFYDYNFDRQTFLTSVKIADELTSRLNDETKSEFYNIPNFELVPRNFKKLIIDNYISLEPDEIKNIDGLEDEICDYILFNIKNENCYNLTNKIVDEIIDSMEMSTFEDLLNDTFEEHNKEYIKYIEKKYVAGKHKDIDCEDEWLARRIFNRIIVKIQLIQKRMIEAEKYSKQKNKKD